MGTYFFPFLKLAATIKLGNYSQYDQDINYHQGEYLYSIANVPKYYWLANTQHDVHLEQPQQFQNKVLTFLGKIQ
ncbi:MAG: hypothetical protein Q7R95_04085 [bacterium]|nr:hypothetical protein [bacterium]